MSPENVALVGRLACAIAAAYVSTSRKMMPAFPLNCVFSCAVSVVRSRLAVLPESPFELCKGRVDVPIQVHNACAASLKPSGASARETSM
jgi:hypothetical protein